MIAKGKFDARRIVSQEICKYVGKSKQELPKMRVSCFQTQKNQTNKKTPRIEMSYGAMKRHGGNLTACC